MKWLKPSIAVVLFVAAMYFAYQSFESSFNPRRGHEHESGQHPMSPAMTEMMRRSNAKKQEDAAKKGGTKSPDHTKAGKDAAKNGAAKTPDATTENGTSLPRKSSSDEASHTGGQ